jgi:hypothetical protein
MKPICAAAVAKVLGREPTKAEQDSIQARIYASMKELQAKDPDAWSSMSRESRLLEGAKLARAKTLEDTTRAHAATLRDVELKAREIDNLGRVEAGVGKGKGQLNALNQRTLFDAKLEGKGTSLEQDIHAVYNESMSRLDNFGGKGKFFGAVQNPVEQHALIRAIRGEATGKPEIDKAGESIRRELEILHQKANDAGIHIHELDDWHHPQPIAWEKVAARRDEFEADALNHIDRSKYITRDGTPMTDEQIQKSVAASAETLGTDGANKQIDGAGGYGKGRVGGSRNAPRQLHYKDAASYQFMMDKYGSANNVYSLITHHIRGMARDIATAERFGRDADTFYPQLAERAFMADAKAIGALDIAPEKKEKLLKQLKGQKNNTLNMWKGLRHPDAPGAIPLWARISQNIRGVAQSTLLGGAPSAFPDAAMATEYMNLRGIARSRVLGNIAEGLKPTKSNIGFVNRLGIVNSHIDASAHRFGSEELGNHAVKYLNHVVHVGGGLRMFDRGMTHGVAASLMDMIGEHTRNTEFHDLDPATAKLAEQYGITKDHWDTWRAADVEKGPNGNHTMVTPETIYSIPDEKLRPMAEQRMAATSADFKAGADERAARSAKESEWVAGRGAKLDALKQRASDTIAAMEAKADAKDTAAQGDHDARAAEIRAKVDRAEVATDIHRYLATDKAQTHARAFLEAVEEGAAVERQTHMERTHPDNRSDSMIETLDKAPAVGEKMQALIQRYGAGVGAKAEGLGKRQGRADANIADAQRRVNQGMRDRSAKIDDKHEAFEKRISSTSAALDEFTQRMRDHQAKRTELDTAFTQRHEQEIQREMRNLRSGAAKQLLSTVLSETKIGARGGSGTSMRAQLAYGGALSAGKRGTLAGEAAAWLMLLKQTPFGIAKTHMWDVPRSLDTWGAAAAYRAKFMAGSAFLGAVGTEIKDLILGEDPEDLGTMRGLGKVALASGGFGMYGDFLFGERGDHKNGTLTKLLGPGATMIEDALNLGKSVQSTLAGTAGLDPEPGEPKAIPADKLGAQALAFARNYAMPLTRIWYAKAAFNHMAYQQMMENMAPGYSQRVEQRMQARDQSNWWPTGQATPERAPDMSKMLGQQP